MFPRGFNWLAPVPLPRGREGVWHELRQRGGAVRDGPIREDAEAVCDEMARRARHNVEAIVQRLTAEGYTFHANDDKRTPVRAHNPPGARTDSVAAWLTTNFDAVPMTLMSWLRIVGDVWLVGSHPDWPESTGADPLVMEIERSNYPEHSITDYFEDELQSHRDQVASDGEELFELPVAPDRLHKDNTSGGAPYGFVLPDRCADGLLVAEVTMPFVAYLNWVFVNGGFPARTGTRVEWSIRRRLAADLLPL